MWVRKIVPSLVFGGQNVYICENKSYYTMIDKLPTLADENPVGAIFERFPELNVRQIARSMGINESLMQHYVKGVKRPSFDRAIEIENFLHHLGEELLKIKI